jgi:2-keto-4-pentenoate hydratase
LLLQRQEPEGAIPVIADANSMTYVLHRKLGEEMTITHGGRPTRLHDVDPALIGAVLRKNGEIVETGCSGAVLGNPVIAVAWLANKVAQFGVTLEPGHVIMPGSCTRMVPVAAGDTVRADFDRLGHVSVRFA